MDFDRGPNALVLILIGAGAFLLLLLSCCCVGIMIPFLDRGDLPRRR
jgi:hypothetical protein